MKPAPSAKKGKKKAADVEENSKDSRDEEAEGESTQKQAILLGVAEFEYLTKIAIEVGKQVESARAGALAALSTSVFSVNGPFHEGPMVQPTAAATASDEGAYRTPSLRNTSRTGPWGHNGYFTSLDAMIDFHSKKVLTTTEHEDLMAFLKVLDVIDPPSPWNNWPDR